MIVVEDDPVTAVMIEELLRDAGYAVEVLRSAIGVQGAIKRLRPCALLLDLGLPYRSGAALLAELKADPATARIPVIVCSADGRFLREKAAALGDLDCDVLEKPFDLDMLLAKVAAALATGRGETE